MERIQHFADISIRRGCGFGFLAIATAMVGVSADIVIALKTGATSVTLMVAILVLKGLQAPKRCYRDTEVWIMLDKQHDLPETRAQQVFGNILRDRYFWHATLVASAAAFMWLLTFTVQILGRAPQV
ncbi:MAG TPA: hypothetical protein VF342_13510 [Alphaproteobacteria bacterium]